MTYSIVARDPQTGFLGIAVASRYFAVGAVVPHISAGVGAVATQAFVNPLYGPDGLRLLQEGRTPEETAALLMRADQARDQRQFHLIDAHGRNFAHTGAKCIDWAGHLVSDNVSVAGNMLAGPAVVANALSVYQTSQGKPLAERLLDAMQAGEDAGGDKRGKQSAALLIYRDQDYSWLSMRADDHADPLAELRRLYAVAHERYMIMTEAMPTRQNYSGMTDRTDMDQKMAAADADRAARGVASASHSASFARPS